MQTPQGLRGVAMDPKGNPIHHGHFMDGWRGDRWTLPCLFTIPVYPAPNLPPYVARLYQFPIDASHTQSSRWVAMRAATDEDRTKCEKLWHEIAGPRQLQVVAEDKAIVESIGDLAEARADEHLLYPDKDVISARRMLANAYISQLNGVRPVPSRDAFQFPY